FRPVIEGFEERRQRVVENVLPGLQAARAREVDAELRREGELVAATFLIECLFGLQIESALRVRDGLPLRRRLRMAGQETAAILVNALTKACVDYILKALQAL